MTKERTARHSSKGAHYIRSHCRVGWGLPWADITTQLLLSDPASSPSLPFPEYQEHNWYASSTSAPVSASTSVRTQPGQADARPKKADVGMVFLDLNYLLPGWQWAQDGSTIVKIGSSDELRWLYSSEQMPSLAPCIQCLRHIGERVVPVKMELSSLC